MAIPRAFIDELNARTSISAVIGQFVTWDKRKSRPSNGDYWACCPFHQEKTPSFHVTEGKNTYYCFGCHESGNAFSFLEKHRKLDFRQSVEFLARLAGMTVPEETPEDRQKADLHATLQRLVSHADTYYRKQLHKAPGSKALDYIRKRGISPASLELFGIGYAPDTGDLLQDLRSSGFSNEQMIAAGMARMRDDGTSIYPVFRDRLMFPIHNSRNRVIAFGGRAMNDSTPAKYLNSPQTELFNKGTVLYNLAGAVREADGKAPLVVVEGYMDVLALHEAGHGRAVAPLGTAITESQLALLWRQEKVPVICLDGDEAGRRAALRTMHASLPLLKPGNSLRFCILPDGLDPDDMLRESGIGAFRKLVERSVPFEEFLWDSMTAGTRLDSPDQQALLRAELNAAIGRIGNRDIRASYQQYINDRIWSDIVRVGKPGRTRRVSKTHLVREHARIEVTDRHLNESPHYYLAACVLVLCLRHPDLIGDNIVGLENLVDELNEDQMEILSVILEVWQASEEDGPDMVDSVSARLGSDRVDTILNIHQLEILPESRATAETGDAAMLLDDILFRISAIRQFRHLVIDIDARAADESCDHAFRQLVNLNSQIIARSSASGSGDELTGTESFSKDMQELEREIAMPKPAASVKGRRASVKRQHVPGSDLDALHAEIGR